MKSRTIKTIYFIIVFIIVLYCNIPYAKTMELNGIRVSLAADVVKKKGSVGVNLKEDNPFSTVDYQVDEKELEDEEIKVELIVKNNNPYESANVIIEEVPPIGFRQINNNKHERIIKVKIDANADNKYSYNYKYHKSFLKDQYNSILYDENGDIIDKNTSIDYANNDKKKIDNFTNGKYKQEDEKQTLKKGINRIILFLLMFIVCVSLLYIFMIFYRTIKGNDNYFFNDDDPFKCIVIFLLISFIINILFDSNVFAKNYEPQIYEYGKSYEKVIYESVYFNDSIYKFAYKITVSFESTYEISDEDYENDTDGDGLIDAFEYQYMTDKNNVDTDSDGLSDYIEVMLLDYNPLNDDTFNDGIKDGDRDFDNDKLANIEEVRYGTDLLNADTDFDTLTDYDEINVHNTNPLSVDTDEDLLSDSDELKLGLDPNNPRTDGITLDSERKIEQKYTITNIPEELRQGDIFISAVSGSVSGNIDNEVKITKKNEEVFNSMSSFVQSGFEVQLKENESIDIELNVNKVLERKTTLTVVKYEDGDLEVIDTICDSDILKANIGSGTYTVMDSDIVLRDLSIFLDDYIR